MNVYMHLNGFTTETKLPLNHAVPAGMVSHHFAARM